jgi:Tol biopolymer transport system component
VNGKLYALWGLILLALALVGCGKDKEQALPSSASQSAMALKVTDQRKVEVDGRILSLSPDGAWLAVMAGDALCVYAADTLDQQTCANLEGHPLDRRTVAWAPDSSRLAFTEDVLRLMMDGDLWTLEVESGELKNLTDDGVDGGFMEKDNVSLDLVPAWSRDGQTLVFVRSVRQGGEWQGTALYRISADGGEVEELLSVTDELPAAIWYGLGWTHDGKKIVYTVGKPQADAPDNGIWIVDQDGQNPVKLLGTSDALGPPTLIKVSGGAPQALIEYYDAAMRFSAEPNRTFFFLLDLETGETRPLKPTQGEAIEFLGPNTVTFSPDGSKILYVYKDVMADQYRLVVRDLTDEAENVLLTSDEALGGGGDIGMGLRWATNDTLYVFTSPFDGWLLTLGAE